MLPGGIQRRLFPYSTDALCLRCSAVIALEEKTGRTMEIRMPDSAKDGKAPR